MSIFVGGKRTVNSSVTETSKENSLAYRRGLSTTTVYARCEMFSNRFGKLPTINRIFIKKYHHKSNNNEPIYKASIDIIGSGSNGEPASFVVNTGETW